MAAFGINFGLQPPVVGFPTAIAAGKSWVSGAIPNPGRNLVATVTSTQIGAISIQRYADWAMVIPIAAASSTSIVANTAETVSITDGIPSLYFQVTITNTSASAATVSGVAIVSSAD